MDVWQVGYGVFDQFVYVGFDLCWIFFGNYVVVYFQYYFVWYYIGIGIVINVVDDYGWMVDVWDGGVDVF